MTNQQLPELNQASQERLQELYVRRALCKAAIQTLSSVDDSDPDKYGALKHYNGQLAQIDAEIAEITGEIPPVVIGLRPAVLGTRTNSL